MEHRTEVWARRFDLILLVAAALVIPVVIVEQSGAGEPYRTVAMVANWVIWSIFLSEVVVMLAVVPNKWRWLSDNPLEVAIVVLTPPFLPTSLQALRLFRLLRLLRLLRILKAARRLLSPEGVRWAALLALLTAFGGGAAFAAVERDHNDKVHTTWDGVYWAFTTMTTVGYGDISPATNWGRVIAIAVMLVGIGFLTTLIAALAQRFIAPDVRSAELELASDVSAAEADVRAELSEIVARLQALERRLEPRGEAAFRGSGSTPGESISSF
jgi:voltage-gated potassium channel